MIDKIINELKQEEAKLQKAKDGLVENIDQLKVLSDGIDPEAPLYAVVLINMFRGKVLRITPHNWESLRKLKDQWDEMLAAA